MTTIDEADLIFEECEALLNRYSVEIAVGSRLQDSMLFPRHVQHVRNGTGDIGTHDDMSQWREMAGMLDLSKRLLAAERAFPQKFATLRPWLKLFASEQGQLAQTAPTKPGDQDSDKLFELLVALCLMPHIDELAPDVGNGDNPDLLFQFKARTWGIACKRLYSTRPAQFQRTVTKAIAQIEASVAKQGLVFVSLTNVVNHELFSSRTAEGDYRGMNMERMMHLLEVEEQRIKAEIVGVTDRELSKEFRGKKAMPGIVHYISTMYMTGSPDAPIDKTVQRAWSRGRVNELLHLFQDGLNRTSSEYNSSFIRRFLDEPPDSVP